MKKKLTVYVFLTSSIVFMVLSIIIFYRGFEIYTFWWHFYNSSTLEWNNLKIAVPNELIGRYKNNDLIFYNIRHPEEIIVFSKMNYQITDVHNLESEYIEKGYEIFEKHGINILGGEAIWIKAICRNTEHHYYLEDIYLYSRPIRISFLGISDKNRNVFEQTIKNLNRKTVKRNSGVRLDY